MAHIRSTAFIPVQAIPAGGAQATVPASRRWLIKRVLIYNSDASTRLFSVNVQHPAGTALTIARASLTTQTSTVLDLQLVLNAGDVLIISAPVTGPTVTAAGIEFDVTT